MHRDENADQQAPLVRRRADAESLQPKLQVGRADDPLEHEADRTAAIVMQRLNRGTLSPNNDTQPVRRAVQNIDSGPIGAAGGSIDPATEHAINRSGGTALDPASRMSMESAFGADFSGVRVHTGPTADNLNNQLSARAFTTGSDIFIRSGAYQPGTASGQRLLAHELTHVIQQGGVSRLPMTGIQPGTIQRTHGNGYVQRLLREEEAPADDSQPTVPHDEVSTEGMLGRVAERQMANRVQRLAGFEFEISLPGSDLTNAADSGPVGEPPDDVRLRKFLTGGAHANTMVHDFRPGNDWYVVADHDPVGTAIDHARNNLNYQMSVAHTAAGGDDPAPNFIGPVGELRPRVSILEYVTNAFDVQSPIGMNELAAATFEIAQNMRDTANRVVAGNTAAAPLHSAQWYVGVPPLADWQGFGGRNSIPNAETLKERNRVMAEVGTGINPQVTAGILPKNIPWLFSFAGGGFRDLATGQDENLGASAAQSMLRISHAKPVAEAALAKVAKKHHVAYGPDTVGFVSLLAQYVFGTFLDSANHFEISKNIPIFLSKTDLSAGQVTIETLAERPNQWSDAARARLVDEMWTHAAKAYNASKPVTKVRNTTEAAFTKADALSILTAPHAAHNPADMFTVGTPGAEGVVDRPLGLDPHIYQADPLISRLAKEIPLEFRAIASIATPEDLLHVVARVVGLLRLANQERPGS